MEIYRNTSFYNVMHENVTGKCQRWGVLWKKPVSQNGAVNKPASKWSKRFFVVKEGFLLYYPENEKRDFDKKRFFNLHPKGVIPLGGCVIEPANDPNRSFTIKIEHEDFNGPIVIAPETEHEREKWIDVLRKSGRITWKNAELGESMIQTLEKQSLELARDSQRYREQVHLGAEALREEMDKSEELEKIALELEVEKQKIEEIAKELLEEKEATQIEMEETLAALRLVATEKEELSKTSEEYQNNLQLLAQQREETMSALNQREDEAKKLADKNVTLECETVSLRDNLNKLDEQRTKLESQMLNIEESLREKEMEREALEEEKATFNQQAKELESSIRDLAVQKEMTDQELKEEIIARRDAERRLQKAESSLVKLEAALKESRTEHPPEMKEEEKIERDNVVEEQIFTSVANLKKFFEDVAMEAQIDAHKPIIMKNAVHARKSFVRKTKSFKLKKERDKRFARHSFASFSSLIPSEHLFGPLDRSANRHSLAVNPDREFTTRQNVMFDLSSLGIITEDEVSMLKRSTSDVTFDLSAIKQNNSNAKQDESNSENNQEEDRPTEDAFDGEDAIDMEDAIDADGTLCQSASTDENYPDVGHCSSISEVDSDMSES